MSFNLLDIDWINGVAPDDGVQLKLLNYFVTIAATQHVNQPTRNDTILDLLFSNDPMIVSDIAVDVPFSTSDYNSLYFTLIVSCDGSDNSRSDYLYEFGNAEYISIRNYLSNIDWLTEFGACTSAADVWNVYCNHITFVLSTHVPRKYFSG